ncbi:hypothetical protein UFOVP1212_12 [uncultured Caudovirales phage]|uniref:Uncharacterized protein n=1 Tax=uncultured Caudovirales phage TaxID=2100421 RepID=A0A6J5R5S7_9CAUD|nr:hypothetical protein UFOVP1212_12 [uncultured Caudovirales phage]
MAKIIDTNRHGIRREIDHQYKPKKRIRPNKAKLSTDSNKLSTDISTDIDISIVRSTDASVKGANNVKRGN